MGHGRAELGIGGEPKGRIGPSRGMDSNRVCHQVLTPPPRLQSSTWASLFLHSFNSRCRSKDIYWSHWGFTWGKGTNKCSFITRRLQQLPLPHWIQQPPFRLMVWAINYWICFSSTVILFKAFILEAIQGRAGQTWKEKNHFIGHSFIKITFVSLSFHLISHSCLLWRQLLFCRSL